jgi:hypothetical protein
VPQALCFNYLVINVLNTLTAALLLPPLLVVGPEVMVLRRWLRRLLKLLVLRIPASQTDRRLIHNSIQKYSHIFKKCFATKRQDKLHTHFCLFPPTHNCDCKHTNVRTHDAHFNLSAFCLTIYKTKHDWPSLMGPSSRLPLAVELTELSEFWRPMRALLSCVLSRLAMESLRANWFPELVWFCESLRAPAPWPLLTESFLPGWPLLLSIQTVVHLLFSSRIYFSFYTQLLLPIIHPPIFRVTSVSTFHACFLFNSGSTQWVSQQCW